MSRSGPGSLRPSPERSYRRVRTELLTRRVSTCFHDEEDEPEPGKMATMGWVGVERGGPEMETKSWCVPIETREDVEGEDSQSESAELDDWFAICTYSLRLRLPSRF